MAEHEGPLADEALRLIGAVQEWARHNFPAAAEGGTADGAVCQWCPLCQFMAVLRGERPEVTARVSEAASALTSAFRAVLDATGSKQSDPGASRVQHIDLGADPGGAEPDRQ